jgi:cytochrome c oxidase subunit 3
MGYTKDTNYRTKRFYRRRFRIIKRCSKNFRNLNEWLDWRWFNLEIMNLGIKFRKARFYKFFTTDHKEDFNLILLNLTKLNPDLLNRAHITNLHGHSFHLVTPSPWPIFTSIASFTLLVGVVAYMHRYENGGLTLILGLISLVSCMAIWWRDVIRESTWQGHHTMIVQRGLRLGFALFILSEIMFFFSVFWAFFHSSLAPSIEIGSVWPPVGLTILNPWEVPFLNTLVLLMSGVTITLAHHCIVNQTKLANIGFFFTVILAIFFTALQGFEYIYAPFEFADGIYGSTFFFSTGFHGFHVFIGTCFIIVCWIRFNLKHFTKTHHLGFEFAAWYWHFVDVVWLFLFVSIYWWGSLS